MRKHALDRQMRLAGVGGTEDGGDACARSPVAGIGREGHYLEVLLAVWIGGKCLTLRRIWGRSLSLGTILERKEGESLTPMGNLLRSPQHVAHALLQRH